MDCHNVLVFSVEIGFQDRMGFSVEVGFVVFDDMRRVIYECSSVG
jgi:hypothetical protein